MVPSGSRIRFQWAGPPIATVIGTTSGLGAGLGSTMRLGVLRPSTMAAGTTSAVIGVGVRDRSMRDHSTALPSLVSSEASGSGSDSDGEGE